VNTEASVLECQPQERVYAGWIYAFGLYQPRWQIARHLNSDWSRVVLLAKRRSEGAINRFGQVIAEHLQAELLEDQHYVITHVPAEEDHELYLFLEFGRCATEMLADSIYSHLKDKARVSLERLLVQVKPKERKQRQCVTDRERAENVSGIYETINAAEIAGKIVILVDDVLTSGATMAECARVLRLAGAKGVMGVALARTERMRSPVFASTVRDGPGDDAA
jgi:predicted amidophosphoribosyltransferase